MGNASEIKGLASRVREHAGYSSSDPYVSIHVRPALMDIAKALALIADEQKRMDERLQQLGV